MTALARRSRDRRRRGGPPPGVERCDRCRRRIVWTVTTATGARMPVDDEPSDNGNVLLLSDTHTSGRPFSRTLGPGDAIAARADGVPLRQHHRLSCTATEAWPQQRAAGSGEKR